ncbi:hypothetical protein [Streptomyces armeniacus]|uniref:DUF7919 family protein n=1 Tax=Streptomyces armeniacus TaxID=83291 RepID=UPI001FE82417|nr:hypothetical protein [Streptomyces armeniacus]
MKYEEMAPYEYFSESVPQGVRAVCVGWLEQGSQFSLGEVDGGFIESLGLICRDYAQMRTRGWHRCELAHQGAGVEYPVTIQVEDDVVSLGGAEVRVVSADGTWLIAPDLVHHYVTEHSYLPPDEFVEAVTARRIAPGV